MRQSATMSGHIRRINKFKNKTFLSSVLRTLISEVGADDKEITANCVLLKTILNDIQQSTINLAIAVDRLLRSENSKAPSGTIDLAQKTKSCTGSYSGSEASPAVASSKNDPHDIDAETEDRYTGNIIIQSFLDSDFKTHFGVTRETIERILRTTSAFFYQNKSVRGRPSLPMATRLLLTFWMLTSQDTYNSIANRFNLGKGVCHRLFFDTCELLYDMIGQVILWPEQSTWDRLQSTFESISGLPSVVAAIGSCHIPIKTDVENGDLYLNDRGYPSVVLQGVCTPDLKFVDVYIGLPGSVASELIFRNSDIYCCIATNSGDYIPKNGYIVGNCAFPLEEFLMTPYQLDNDRDVLRNAFNDATNQCWHVLQKSFSLLHGRFRRLQCVDMGRIDILPKVIAAICVLHNLILMQEDSTLEETLIDDIHYIDTTVGREGNQFNNVAEARRDQIASSLYQNNFWN